MKSKYTAILPYVRPLYATILEFRCTVTMKLLFHEAYLCIGGPISTVDILVCFLYFREKISNDFFFEHKKLMLMIKTATMLL